MRNIIEAITNIIFVIVVVPPAIIYNMLTEEPSYHIK